MSGLEIPALVAGIIGATAGTVSATKDASSFHSHKVSKQGNREVVQDKWVSTSGEARAGISKRGDMYAMSSGNGKASAASKYRSK